MFLALFPYLVIAGLCVLLWRSRARSKLATQGSAISSRSGSQTGPDPTQRPWEDEARVLQTTLSSIDQGIYMIGEDGRIGTYNQRLCELLDLPESFMASRPTLHEMTRFQAERGDFGQDALRVGESAREHVLSLGASASPQSYVRATRDGRMLEVRTKRLSAAAMVRTFTDVTAMREAGAATREGMQRLTLALEGARLALWDYNLATHRVYLSASWSEMLGGPRQAQSVDFGDWRGFVPQDEQAAVAGNMTPLLKGEIEEFMLEHQVRRLDGGMLRVVTQGRVTERAPDGHALRAIGTHRDVTAEREAERALREGEARWKLALESAGDGMWDRNVQSGEEIVSRRCKQMYGYADDEIADRTEAMDGLTHPEDMAAVLRARQDHFEGKTSTYSSEHRIRCKDGSWKWILSRGAVINRDAQGIPLRMIGTHTDITERKNTEALVWQQANFDVLTGLPNRRMLRDRLAQGMLASRRDGSSLAVLFLDLDHFKEINDTLGHDRGDQLLIEAARRIRACVRETDTVGRMGGDEFTVLLSELRETQRVELIAQSVLESLSQAFELGDEQCFISASIGVAIFPHDASSIEELFKHADQALYVAKEAGRNCFRYFTASLQAEAQTRMRLALDLRRALPEHQLQVVYQPVVDLANGSIYKAEALVRWHHPERGLVSPYTFIPIAESTGLIVGIGDWVFEQAALQVQLWRARHDPRFQISVNKSPVQFHQAADSQRRWIERLATLNLPGDSIVVEITESLLMDKRSDVKGHLLELRQAGIAVALDDFGTGYSSLSYLQNYELDYLKIDQSFVRNLRPGSKDSELCKAIIVMAQALGLKVIAEGVETLEQRDWLRAQGCDYGQGYLFAKPMPAEELDALLASMASLPSQSA